MKQLNLKLIFNLNLPSSNNHNSSSRSQPLNHIKINKFVICAIPTNTLQFCYVATSWISCSVCFIFFFERGKRGREEERKKGTEQVRKKKRKEKTKRERKKGKKGKKGKKKYRSQELGSTYDTSPTHRKKSVFP